MDDQRCDLDRRKLLVTAAGLAVGGGLIDRLVWAAGPASAGGTTPSADSNAGTGKLGEFDFLAGNWKIANRRLKDQGQDQQSGSKEWDEFPGEATCWSVLKGGGSIEELRIPARGFHGMGIRLLDLNTRLWNDFWVSGRNGVLTTPGMTGVFKDGAGVFEVDDVDGDQPIKVRGVWDQITKSSCRWYQAVSRDGGKTWEENWVMHWTRV